MKIQIDTDAKTIRVEQRVKFSEILKALNGLFPDESWKEYDLMPDVIQHYGCPIVVREYRPWWEYRPYQYRGFAITTGGATTSALTITNCATTSGTTSYSAVNAHDTFMGYPIQVDNDMPGGKLTLASAGTILTFDIQTDN